MIMNELLKEYKIIIDDDENMIGYVKDIINYLHNEITEQTKDWNNFEDSICQMAHIIHELNANFNNDDLIKISECPMDEYGLDIEVLKMGAE